MSELEGERTSRGSSDSGECHGAGRDEAGREEPSAGPSEWRERTCAPVM
jgi:hypothetical protein